MSTFVSSAEDTPAEDSAASPPYADGTTSDAGDPAADPAADAAGDAVRGAGDEAEQELDDVSGGESEDEYNRILFVPPTSLTIGPNIREDNAEPTREEVKDYETYGVEDAIKAYRDADGTLVVLKGQRRLLTAVKANVESVPVWVQPPPSEDEKAAAIDRISMQYRWTRHRKGHTRRDAFRAFEQLKLFGQSVTAIAKRLSVPRREVADALKVGTSELAATAADKYDLTLEQAAEIAECEKVGDLEAAKALVQTAAEGPHNFKTLVQRLRNDRAEAEWLRKSVAACTEQLTAAGVVILDDSIPDWNGDTRSLNRLRPSPDHEPGTELTIDEHAGCPGHSAWITNDWDEDGNKIAVPAYGCSDFVTHGHALLNAPAGWVDYHTAAAGAVIGDSDNGGPNSVSASTSSGQVDTDVDTEVDTDVDSGIDAEAAYAAHMAAELERRKAEIQRAWEDNNTKNAEASMAVRHEWLAGFVRRRSIPKWAQKWLALRTLAGASAPCEAMQNGHQLAHELLGLPEPEPVWNWSAESGFKRGELHDRIENASDTKAAVYTLFLFLCAFEEAFGTDAWRNPTEVDQLHMRMLIDLDYEAPDIDRKVLNPDNLEDIIAAELGTEHTDTDGTDAVGDVHAEAGAEPHVAESDQPADMTGDGDIPDQLAAASGQTPDNDSDDDDTDDGAEDPADVADPRVVSADQDGGRAAA